MARMHARKRGRSGSKKPFRDKPPEWMKMTPEEVEELVVKLYNRGNSTSEIGMILRDEHGIPSVKLVTGSKMKKILEKHGIEFDIPEDLTNLMARAINIHKHLQSNRKDLHNRRQLSNTEAKIRRLVKYYKRNRVLPEDWKYSLDRAKLLVD